MVAFFKKINESDGKNTQRSDVISLNIFSKGFSDPPGGATGVDTGGDSLGGGGGATGTNGSRKITPTSLMSMRC